MKRETFKFVPGFIIARRWPALLLGLSGFLLLTQASSQARAEPCQPLIDAAIDMPRRPGQVVYFRANGGSLSTREGGSFASIAMKANYDMGKNPIGSVGGREDSFWLAESAEPGGGIYHAGEFTQVFPQRPNTDRNILEIRRGGRLTLRSLTWGFVMPLDNLACDKATSGRIFVRSLNVFPGWGSDAYSFILIPSVEWPLR